MSLAVLGHVRGASAPKTHPIKGVTAAIIASLMPLFLHFKFVINIVLVCLIKTFLTSFLRV